MHNYCVYLLIINFLSGTLFSFDKWGARKKRQRISERTLHLFELLGGVFANLILMYTLRHKNRKFSYWGWSWLILIGWVISSILFEKNL